MTNQAICRGCRRPGSTTVAGTTACARCLDAGAWIRFTHGAEEQRPGVWLAVLTTQTSPDSPGRRKTRGPYGRQEAIEVAADIAHDEAERHTGHWAIEIVAA